MVPVETSLETPGCIAPAGVPQGEVTGVWEPCLVGVVSVPAVRWQSPICPPREENTVTVMGLKKNTNTDEKGFCDISGLTFLQLSSGPEATEDLLRVPSEDTWEWMMNTAAAGTEFHGAARMVLKKKLSNKWPLRKALMK